jgi:hypothetical protein
MKRIGWISTGVLLLLGSAASLYAQQEEAKPPKQEEKAKPEKQQQNKGRQQQDQGKQQQQRAQKQAQDQNKQQEQRAQKQQQDQGKQQQQRAREQDQNRQRSQQEAHQPSQQRQRVEPAQRREVWQEHRAHNWQSEHRDWQQRGGYSGYRIPDDRYRGHFGQDHWFRIHSYPFELYGGYPRFQYGGFWFGFMDPWPEYWSDDWYDNDDVYVVYSDDGYYLYNRRYPQDRIAITVYVN